MKPPIVMKKWNHRFYDLAKLVSQWSKDPSTKVGAVIVNNDKQVLALGYNGFPRGVYDSQSRYEERDVKHKFVVHAERNALDNAFTDVRGASMYVTHFPCSECAKGIIQRGIRKIFTPPPDPNKQYIQEEGLINASITMFIESGVEINYLNAVN